jgi:TatD DNase family protein
MTSGGLLSAPTVVAVGETGLDYYYDNSPRDLQREALARHLQLAQQCSLPIVLHCRDAHEDLRDVLEAEGKAEVFRQEALDETGVKFKPRS